LSGDVGCPSAGVFACGLNAHAPFSTSQEKAGWVAGGGVEYDLNPNWIVGVEYLYYGFNGSTFNINTIDLSTGAFARCCINYSFENFSVQTVRARLEYKF
jgi:opacity protein-like surface antigen